MVIMARLVRDTGEWTIVIANAVSIRRGLIECLLSLSSGRDYRLQ